MPGLSNRSQPELINFGILLLSPIACDIMISLGPVWYCIVCIVLYWLLFQSSHWLSYQINHLSYPISFLRHHNIDCLYVKSSQVAFNKNNDNRTACTHKPNKKATAKNTMSRETQKTNKVNTQCAADIHTNALSNGVLPEQVLTSL